MMNKAPKVGTRVHYRGGNVVGECVGTVTAIYPTEFWDDDLDRSLGLRPEREWRVSMKPDVLPERWSYPDNDSFAPGVSELTRAK